MDSRYYAYIGLIFAVAFIVWYVWQFGGKKSDLPANYLEKSVVAPALKAGEAGPAKE